MRGVEREGSGKEKVPKKMNMSIHEIDIKLYNDLQWQIDEKMNVKRYNV